jgi:hypothetical protein
MGVKKIKLEEQAISEILAADTDSESGDEASDVEEYFEEQKKTKHHQQHQQQQQASAEAEPQAATGGGLPTWDYLKEGTQIFILLSVQQKVSKKNEAPHTNKDSSPLSVLMLFFTEIFYLLVEQTNVYY